MLIGNNEIFSAPVRSIKAKVELSIGDSTPAIFTGADALKEITIERVGENKFFGFGIGQKANIKLIDRERALNFTTDHKAVIYFDGVKVAPTMYVSEVHRDENTNELSITLYDKLYDTFNHTIGEITQPYSIFIDGYLMAIADVLGTNCEMPIIPELSLQYPEGANLDGTETFREVMDDIAEVMQTIYYISADDIIKFYQLDKDGDPVYTIDKSQYITLDTKTNRRLTSIVSVTELGDNIEASTGLTGTTFFIRNNAFLDLREDRADIVQNMMDAQANLTINQFSCAWRGNYLLEPGDKIALVAKDGSKVYSYLLNDSITYNGTLAQTTMWEYAEENVEHTNPVTIGDALKQTYAKVDKVNKQIELVASDTDEKISQIQINAEEIMASVNSVTESTNDAFNSINEEINKISNQASLGVSAEDVEIIVQRQLINGVERVETSTGFLFNEEGLTINKSESEISTTITEDGMKIKKGNSNDVLVANNEGVKAIDLHATTYLAIGKYSRFEDYSNQQRTACYWIGG